MKTTSGNCRRTLWDGENLDQSAFGFRQRSTESIVQIVFYVSYSFGFWLHA